MYKKDKGKKVKKKEKWLYTPQKVNIGSYIYPLKEVNIRTPNKKLIIYYWNAYNRPIKYILY